jgi:hypothetical protein
MARPAFMHIHLRIFLASGKKMKKLVTAKARIGTNAEGRAHLRAIEGTGLNLGGCARSRHLKAPVRAPNLQ